jgi:predicted RNase H-like nuclease (RuvC/YqgF family)
MLGRTQDELTAAQWAVVQAFRQGLDNGITYLEARQALRDIFIQAPGNDPEAWATDVAQALLKLIAQLQTAAKSVDQYEVARLRSTCDSLRLAVNAYRADPLKAQVERLTEQRDKCEDEVDRLTRQVHHLEAALAQAQQVHQSEIARTQAEIVALNRIVVEQQEALNERDA